MKKLFVVLLLGLAIHAKAKAQDQTKAVEIKRFRFAIQGGFSQLLAKTSDAVPAENRDYVSELKSGYHYGADLTYFIKPTWGLGAKFSQFKSANTGIMGSMDPMGNLVFLSMEDNITHTFVGPSFTTKYTSANNKHSFLFGIGLGYLGYNNDGVLDAQAVKMTAGTFGSALDANYDFNLTKNIAIGAQISITGGTLTKMKYTAGGTTTTRTFDKDEKESLSRLDLSLGARFNF